MPDAIQVADRFHLHQNLLDAIRKSLNREIPASIPIVAKNKDIKTKSKNKKIHCIVDNLSEAEQKNKQMIAQLQALLKEGCSVSETARRMGVSRSTVMKYRKGCPDVLCRNLHKGGILHQYREFIIANLQNGYTQSEIIRQLQHLYGYYNS